MDFATKSFRKDETLTSWTLLQHICPHFWAWLLNTIAVTPKSEDKYVIKVFNWSEFHLSEMTCYKIHTLNLVDFLSFQCPWTLAQRQVSYLNFLAVFARDSPGSRLFMLKRYQNFSYLSMLAQKQIQWPRTKQHQ